VAWRGVVRANRLEQTPEYSISSGETPVRAADKLRPLANSNNHSATIHRFNRDCAWACERRRHRKLLREDADGQLGIRLIRQAYTRTTRRQIMECARTFFWGLDAIEMETTPVLFLDATCSSSGVGGVKAPAARSETGIRTSSTPGRCARQTCRAG
jgi:hypothetical protein